MDLEKSLDVIAKAWGRGAKGHCFFPTISGSAEITSRRERLATYREGRAFQWPEDRVEILKHLEAHRDDDVYWCPSLFDEPERKWEYALNERCLWADLDEVDPKTIDDYPPTVAWETSPGRYQALWLLAKGQIQGASWPGNENQRLTYHLDADRGGWDTTQLLRIPGWVNHKPDHRSPNGEYPKGRLLWDNGRKYFVDDFANLPDVPDSGAEGLTDVIEDQIATVDRHEVWARVRLKVTQRARDLYSARVASGDRSDHLWYLMRCLADAGCTVPEIVAVVKETVWNKFDGRDDEMRRLVAEAAKAISRRAPEVEQRLEEERAERPQPVSLLELVRNIPTPRWLVKNVLTVGACGFIAGQPKSYKSWIALDLAMSVAEGLPFLDYFRVLDPGPVLYVQEEDSLPLLKARTEKIWAGKQGWKIKLDSDGLYLIPPHQTTNDPQVFAVASSGFVVSDPSWQAWLDEQLSAKDYRLLVIDPLMMVLGDVKDEAGQMTEKVYKPLKMMARKHEVAVQVVHHMRKTGEGSDPRGGQRLLGSVANHAWSEDSTYVTLGKKGSLEIEVESKTAPVDGFTLHNVRAPGWTPFVEKRRSDDHRTSPKNPRHRSETRRANGDADSGNSLRAMILETLRSREEGATLTQLSATLEEDKARLRAQLRALEKDEMVEGRPTGRRAYGREVMRWLVR